MDILTNFFSFRIHGFFRAYSLTHILTLFIIGFIIIASIFFMKKSSKDKQFIFRIVLAVITILQEISYLLWILLNNAFTLEESLPLNMCAVSLFFAFFVLLTKNKTIFNILYFWGIIGSFYALFFPSLLHDFPTFRFFEFFVAHACVLLTIFYFIFVENYSMGFKETFLSYLFTDIYVVIVFIINLLLKSNYLFLINKPSFGNIVDMSDIVFKLWLVFGTLFLFIVLYLPFFLIKKINVVYVKN